MAVSINQIQRHQDNGESDLEKLARIVQIGASGYGVYDAMGRRQMALEQAAREKTTFDQAQEYQAKMKDVNSPLYKAAQGAYSQAGVKIDPNVSMYDAKQLYGDAGDLLKAKLSAQAKQAADPLAALMAQERLDKLVRERQDEAFKKTPEGKLQNLGASDKARYDNLVMGLGALQSMGRGISQGDFIGRPSILGDNDFTLGAKNWEEAIGRMQSGGAINIDEGKKFRALAPGLMDSDQMRAQKLNEAQGLMVQRLRTLGFDASQAKNLGLDPSLFAGINSPSKIAKDGRGLPLSGSTANAAPSAPDFSKMTDEQLKLYLSGK